MEVGHEVGEATADPWWHRQLNRFVTRLAELGLTPRDTVTLVTRGRRSGVPRSTPVTWAAVGGERYLVSLAGETQWVRNVRASGFGILRHGRAEVVRLTEIATEERPPVIRAYRGKWALTRSPARAARDYFGLRPDPSLEEIAAIADHYPVVRIERVGADGSPIGLGCGPCSRRTPPSRCRP